MDHLFKTKRICDMWHLGLEPGVQHAAQRLRLGQRQQHVAAALVARAEPGVQQQPHHVLAPKGSDSRPSHHMVNMMMWYNNI